MEGFYNRVSSQGFCLVSNASLSFICCHPTWHDHRCLNDVLHYCRRNIESRERNVFVVKGRNSSCNHKRNFCAINSTAKEIMKPPLADIPQEKEISMKPEINCKAMGPVENKDVYLNKSRAKVNYKLSRTDSEFEVP